MLIEFLKSDLYIHLIGPITGIVCGGIILVPLILFFNRNNRNNK